MAQILNFFRTQNKNHFASVYPDAKTLFDGLKLEENDAIRRLYSKTSGAVFNIGKTYQLPDGDIEELICDCITLLLQKIRDGHYVFQGFDPGTYVVEIAKNKVKRFKRNHLKDKTAPLDESTDLTDEPDFTSLAATELLEKLLALLHVNCRNLIRLKYLDELRDKEVIDRKLTQYTTVDALKNHRAKCMKKLVDIATRTGGFSRRSDVGG